MTRFILLFLFIYTQLIYANKININDGLYRLTYDRVQLPQNEIMGLAGINYIYKTKYDFYYGLSGYAALEGHRGGFFTGGVEVGKYFSLTNDILLDIGMFVGGGGGGAAPQGGGLMLRPHSGLLYSFDRFNLGAYISRVEFPNGEIKSDQISMQVEVPFKSIYSTNSRSLNLDDILPFTSPHGSIGWKNNYLSMTMQNYYTPDSMKNTEGQDHIGIMNLVGVEYGSFINDNLFALVSSAGAYGGKTDGYMEVFAGCGYKYPFTSHIGMSAKALVGGAGGGRINSAGGASYKANLSAYANLSKNVELNIGAGHIESFIGTYEAKTLNANLTYNMDILSFIDAKNSISSLDYELGKWSVRITNQTYQADKELRYHRRDLGHVHLAGLKLDRYIIDNIYITGQAYAAHSGGSGGYAAGLFGLGYITDPYFERVSFLVEAASGAAGGGSIDVGGGIIAQVMAGVDYKVTKNLSIQAQVGRIKAMEGSLNTGVADVGISYKFYKVEKATTN